MQVRANFSCSDRTCRAEVISYQRPDAVPTNMPGAGYGGGPFHRIPNLTTLPTGLMPCSRPLRGQRPGEVGEEVIQTLTECFHRIWTSRRRSNWFRRRVFNEHGRLLR